MITLAPTSIPSVLEKSETFARAPVGLRVVRRGGYMLLLSQEIYVGARYDGQTVCLTDTLDGLEVRARDGKVFLLPRYRKICKPNAIFRGKWAEREG
jgi:hypothetical protein